MPQPGASVDCTLPSCEGARAILAAAEELFAEKGYNAVSMSEIAARAGVSKANIFHHFANKHALYLAVLRSACAHSAELLQATAMSKEPYPARLERFVTQHLRNMLERERASRLVLREVQENGSAHARDLVEQVFGDSFAALVGMLREGQQTGYLRKDIDPAMLATLLVGANVFFFETRAVLRHLPGVQFADDPARYSEMLMDILGQGLHPPNAPATGPRSR